MPLASSTKAPKVGGLDHLAGELVADLDLLGHLADALDERVALLAGLRVDADGAVVVDVDLGVELLRQARIVSPPLPMTLPIFSVSIWIALIRGAYGDSSRAARDRLDHLAEDTCGRASRACVRASRRMSNVTPVILMSIWSAVMPFSVPATLKSMSPRWSSTPAMSVRTM